MLEEPDILCGNRRIHKIRRQLVISYIRAVLYMECGQYGPAVIGYHLRCKLAVRAFKLLERRNIRKSPYKPYQKHE